MLMELQTLNYIKLDGQNIFYPDVVETDMPATDGKSAPAPAQKTEGAGDGKSTAATATAGGAAAGQTAAGGAAASGQTIQSAASQSYGGRGGYGGGYDHNYEDGGGD